MEGKIFAFLVLYYMLKKITGLGMHYIGKLWLFLLLFHLSFLISHFRCTVERFVSGKLMSCSAKEKYASIFSMTKV